MFNRWLLLIISSSLLIGCTTAQTTAIGLNQSTVTDYAQNMSSTELCQVLYYDRSTTQTLASVATEFNRRSLSKTLCEEKLNQYYSASFINWLSTIDFSDDEDEGSAVTLPAEI